MTTKMAEMNNNKRIAHNTLLLYSRSLINMIIGLYTSRLTLEALGIVDYGIYNVVGSLVALFGVFNGSLNAAISRFITYELGKGNLARLKTVFSSSMNILFIFALVILVLAETLGLWAVNTQLVFPEGRIVAANWVYQLSVMTFLISLLGGPYIATLTAHENFGIIAKVEIANNIIKVGCVLMLYYSPIDRLIYFAGYCMLLTLAANTFYKIYSKRHYEERHYQRGFDKPFLKEIGSFYSWNLFGSIAWLLKSSGINIVINLFFGVLMNAAQAVALQVSTGVTALMGSFSGAMQPQITKSYASRDYQYMWNLVFNGTRYGFFLLAVFILPLCFNMKFILSLWLKTVPSYTEIFTILFLINVLLESYSSYIITVMLATGKIAFYQASVGTVMLLNVPLSYLAFKCGYGPTSFLTISIVLTLFALGMRLFIIKRLLQFSIRSFISKIVARTIFVSLLICSANLFLHYIDVVLPYADLISLLVSPLIAIILIYLIGITQSEKSIIIRQIKSKLHL